MDVVRFAIEKPVTVIVGVILVVMFGWIGLQRMPYQLSPTVVSLMKRARKRAASGAV